MGAELWTAIEDRYGGVIIEVSAASGTVTPEEFEASLRQAVTKWLVDGKRGLWLKLPTASAAFAAAGVTAGFEFHHAQSGYVMMAQATDFCRHGFDSLPLPFYWLGCLLAGKAGLCCLPLRSLGKAAASERLSLPPVPTSGFSALRIRCRSTLSPRLGLAAL